VPSFSRDASGAGSAKIDKMRAGLKKDTQRRRLVRLTPFVASFVDSCSSPASFDEAHDKARDKDEEFPSKSGF
jgi:hypothetical protein